MTRRLLLSFAVLLVTIAILIWSTGGFAAVVGGVRVSARSPALAAVLGAAALAAWTFLAGRAGNREADVAALAGWLERRGVALVAIVTAIVAARFHTYSASGADPSGYLSEAAMLARGALSQLEPLAREGLWANAPRTLAPLGWQPSAGAVQVPTYAVGLPLVMAIPHTLAGAIGASLVVCASAALAVWFTGRLAHAFAGGIAGVTAAIGFATLPVLLFESLQPMSDVPVTAAWLGSWWWVLVASRRTARGAMVRAALIAGVFAAAAATIRPNLAPLAAVPGCCVFFCSGMPRARALACFAIPVALAAVLIGYLQWRWFGSPVRSGYGTASEIFALSNVTPNLRLYGGWLIETSGAWLLAGAALLAVSTAPVARWMMLFAGGVIGAYLVYGTFETWPYLRFLLPAMAVLSVGAAVVTWRGLAAAGPSARIALVLLLTLALGGWQLARARELGVFTVRANQLRAVLAGHYLAAAASPDAVFLTGEQSGAMRYYTGRSILRWDLLDDTALADAADQVHTRGREIWIVLDDWEVPLFRARFRAASLGALDWPPALDAGTLGRTQAWRVRDRAPFVTGARVSTDRVREEW